MSQGVYLKFYSSAEWQKCREAYKKQARYLCEECLREGKITPGVEVHHKIHLTKANINNPEIALNFDNLELLCEYHHDKIHHPDKRRYKVDEFGRIICEDTEY